MTAVPFNEAHARAIRLWLYAVAALVLAMVLVGGATRLTESGLSITEWRPVMGALPPLGEAAVAGRVREISGPFRNTTRSTRA